MTTTTLNPNATTLEERAAWKAAGVWQRGLDLAQYDAPTLRRVIEAARESLLAETEQGARQDALMILAAWDSSEQGHRAALDTLALVGNEAERSGLDIKPTWEQCRDRSLRVREIVAAALSASIR